MMSRKLPSARNYKLPAAKKKNSASAEMPQNKQWHFFFLLKLSKHTLTHTYTHFVQVGRFCIILNVFATFDRHPTSLATPVCAGSQQGFLRETARHCKPWRLTPELPTASAVALLRTTHWLCKRGHLIFYTTYSEKHAHTQQVAFDQGFFATREFKLAGSFSTGDDSLHIQSICTRFYNIISVEFCASAASGKYLFFSSFV